MSKKKHNRLTEFAASMSDSDLADSALPEEVEESSSFNNGLGLLLTTVVLIAFGLMMIYSATSHFNGTGTASLFRNQFAWMIIGVVCGTTAFFMGHKLLAKLSYYLLGGTALLLIWARCGRAVNGAHRWIHLGGFTFQPSEMAKIAVAIFVAWYCSENLRTFTRWSKLRNSIYTLAAVVGTMMGLIWLGNDLGTTALVGAVAFFTAFAAGLHWLYWLIPMVASGIIVLCIRMFDAMRWARMTIFLDPEAHQTEKGMQLWFSLLALGSGSWLGVGLTKSRFKADYLPEKQTDFILAIVGEELGFAGIIIVLLLYTLWGFFAVRIALKAKERCGMLMAWALVIGVMLQAAINFGAMSGVFPTKGMPAPFISYGGSNLLGCMISTGILVAISAYTDNPGYRCFWRRRQDEEDGGY
ncbi:MAG: cell division protein FtsW [Lentisphaeria bacterium]|nr:cell division protein FtsW [Lentisphaeria bacterium]